MDKMVRRVEASEYCREVTGGAQARIVKTFEGDCYVIKAPNNPQSLRVLANELFGSLILRQLGIATPEPAIVNVSSRFVEENEDMKVFRPGHRERWKPGPCFGSRLHPHAWRLIITGGRCDELRHFRLNEITNAESFNQVLVFDMWALQLDSRQAALIRLKGRNKFTAYMIDQGFCFGGPDWNLNRIGRFSKYGIPAVYGGGSGHGFKHGPVIGEMVADAVKDLRAAPNEMSIRRFT